MPSDTNHHLQSIVEIVKIIRQKITDDTDIVWTNYSSIREFQEDIDNCLKSLENENLESLDALRLHFSPTATFQELSISNGWGDEFFLLADRFDEAYSRMKSGV
jgi:hypothetical protein